MVAFLVAGCTSDAGKSVVVAGLCRLFRRRGIAVAPFKAQNMSNNSVVTPTGGEIGRAQALQALASDLLPDTRFNPILLKPGSDRSSQLVVNGTAVGNVNAKNYIEHRTHLRSIAVDALQQLEAEFDIVVCEGAGSPAEINLRDSDIANFGLAQAAQLPVYIVGDIDRGGVLAHFYGTHQIVSPEDSQRIVGFVVNKFRGDPSLLTPGLQQLEHLTGVPTVAVVPFIDGLWVDAEDSLQSQVGVSVGPRVDTPVGKQRVRVAAVRLPRVSNATDIEALACEPGVSVSWSVDPDDIAHADLVVVPGSKATVADLAWLRATGIADALEFRRANTMPMVGICGGFQMMCRVIDDPVESGSDSPVPGLGFFDADIAFFPEKTLIRHPDGAYEVHHGRVVRNQEQGWLEPGLDCQKGVIFGTHRHGVLENDQFRKQFLTTVAEALGKDEFVVDPNMSFHAERLRQLDVIADALEQHWDIDQLLLDVGYAP